MRKSILAATALALATIALAGCGSGEQPPAETAPEAPEGITVANARLMLPAVKGNPGAVYFDVANAGERNMVIRATSVANAGSAAMHTADMQEIMQVAVEPGKTVKFEPGGWHVMAMDLADAIKAGGSNEVTLTFVGGDKISFPAEVRAAGDER